MPRGWALKPDQISSPQVLNRVGPTFLSRNALRLNVPDPTRQCYTPFRGRQDLRLKFTVRSRVLGIHAVRFPFHHATGCSPVRRREVPVCHRCISQDCQMSVFTGKFFCQVIGHVSGQFCDYRHLDLHAGVPCYRFGLSAVSAMVMGPAPREHSLLSGIVPIIGHLFPGQPATSTHGSRPGCCSRGGNSP